MSMLFRFWGTRFNEVQAQNLIGEETDLEELRDLFKNTVSPSKDTQPQYKFARYGSIRTAAGCLRHDGNVISVSGIEVDYDGEEMPFDEACARLDALNLRYIAYTTARHTPSTPRWRIMLPFSKELPPGQRSINVSRLNGVLGAILHKESWTLSVAYYFGNILGRPEATVVVGDGEEFIDERDDLGADAQPYRAPAGQAGKGGKPDFDMLDESELRELIETGQHYYNPAMRLAGLWEAQGVSESDAVQNLENAFDAVPPPARDKKWTKGRSSIPRWVKTAYARAAKRGKHFSAVVDYFENGPLFKGTILFNRFARCVEVCDPFPPKPGQTPGGFRAFADPADTLEAMINLQAGGFTKVGKAVTFDALYLAGMRRGYHPVANYLNGLEWDGEERIHRLFIDYIPGTLPNPDEDPEWHKRVVTYLEAVGRCFMTGGVARIFQPGCKHDHLVVLDGEQALGKSRALAAFVPDSSWFTDDVPAGLVDKDSKQAIDGKWIIELAELPHLRREVDRVKAFFSRSTDRYRPPYARIVADWPRQCVFIGTSKELELPDVTGNRRIWPVEVDGPIDDEKIARDRDQLWAEAVHQYRQCAKWWLPPEIEAIAAEIQDSYVEHDVRDEPIAAWIDTVTPVGETPRFTVREVLEHALGFAIHAKDRAENDFRPIATPADEKRVIRRLRRLGYRPEPHQTKRGGKRFRFWVPVKSRKAT